MHIMRVHNNTEKPLNIGHSVSTKSEVVKGFWFIERL